VRCFKLEILIDGTGHRIDRLRSDHLIYAIMKEFFFQGKEVVLTQEHEMALVSTPEEIPSIHLGSSTEDISMKAGIGEKGSPHPPMIEGRGEPTLTETPIRVEGSGEPGSASPAIGTLGVMAKDSLNKRNSQGGGRGKNKKSPASSGGRRR